ncbi:MAG: glycoside hydrolase family 13 protein [Propionicimonas sp.]
MIYQIYPRSFMDGDGDGLGDLAGITLRLPQVSALGVDAVWLSPFYPSPQADGGYDIADYMDVDPVFGTLGDFDSLLEKAHGLGLKVIIDLVPNHTSNQHTWFVEACAAPAGAPERERYIFREGQGVNGELPPNNWESAFGGPAWTRLPDAAGQWYLHLFDSSQPDLNWRNPEVLDYFDGVLRFWLDRGVDGFRVDVARALLKQDGLPDKDPADGGLEDFFVDGSDTLVTVASEDERRLLMKPANPYSEQPEIHDIFARWKKLVASYDGDRLLCSEAWVRPLAKMALWVRPGEFDQTFNFVYLYSGWNAKRVEAVIRESLSEFNRVGAPSTWVLSNHDVIRHASRLTLASPVAHGDGIGPTSPELPDQEVGLRRARCATLLMLALPGSAYLYNGEELGLPEVVDIADSARQDPTWERSQHRRYGRDGCRVPLPWEAGSTSAGFSVSGTTWLPQPKGWHEFARDSQERRPDSTLNMYRLALRLRREHDLGNARLDWIDGYPSDVIGFRVGDVTVVANFGSSAVTAPSGELIACSGSVGEGTVPPESTIWVLSHQ